MVEPGLSSSERASPMMVVSGSAGSGQAESVPRPRDASWVRRAVDTGRTALVLADSPGQPVCLSGMVGG